MNPEMSMVVKRNEEREALKSVIAQWNANRLDLFELSEPNDDLEFHGVMRFYFQDSGQKVATKCIRVASDATTQVVIETLIEKFRPDMRMLSVPEYALYEIHENGDERRLGPDEKPLLVQLNWHKDDREGRFLLRRIDDKTHMPEGTFQEGGSSFRRKLSKREKKQLKKQEKLNRMKSTGGINNDENDTGVAEKLYTELPETSFTRSISNPEAVMRRRRQQKLERKLQQFRSKDGGPDTGGTLKIYGESLCRDVPYKTLLLSVRDTATQVVKEMLIKYGLDREDPHNYCLVQVNTAVDSNSESKDLPPGSNSTINNREYILDEDECPLAILMNHPQSRGSIMFHVRRRPADYHPRKRKKKPQQKWNQQGSNELHDYRYEDGFDRLPFFLELNPDGTDIAGGTAKRHRLHPNVTEVGSERASPHSQSQSLQLFGPNVQPRHCVIAHTEGIVTVTPCSRDAETYVNGQRIYETTILQNGSIVKFGRIHNFRFLDPCHEERTRQRHDSARTVHDYSYDRQSSRDETGSLTSPVSTGQPLTNGPVTQNTTLNYETTFDVDGNVETRSTSSQGNKEETRSQRSVGSSRDGNRLSNYERYPRGNDPILPAVLEIREETEEALFHALITDLEPTAPTFKLAPAYTLYLAARYRASTHYRPELTPTERAHRLTLMLARVAAMIHNVIQERYCEVKSLALWLANASELLHFLKSDRHVSAFSLDAQDTLADAVQIAFRHLVACLQGELASVMPNFLSDRDDLSHDPEDSSTASVLGVLASAMALLRRCRVNAALTIQLFSQLFHFVNVWAFNRIVAPNSNYCSRAWGLRIKARLAQIEVWAERQGLELAADCHLARLMQAAHLLQAPKYTGEDLATLSSTCFKLNSLQLRALLQKYQPTPDEPRLPHELIDNVVRVAENLADELARSDGREVRLEEEPELALPFLLPEDGYSCEVVRGIPQGLVEFVAPLQHAGLCRLSAQPTSNGLWTVYMGPANAMVRSPSAMSNRSGGFIQNQQEPEIQIIKLHKSNNGMGLSIVAAKGAGQDRLGIYIKSVVKGGAADADGRLQAGDQLLKVDGQSLVGITQEKAAEYLVRTGPVVTLEVAKQGAIYHGLATLLSQPSPVMGRVSTSQTRVNEQTLSPSLSMSNLDKCNDVPNHPGGATKSSSGGGISPLNHSCPAQPCNNRLLTSENTPPVICLEVPTISVTSGNFLMVPDNRTKCYKIPPENDLCLCEDIFQQHQAKLVNCDSEDANAVSHNRPTTPPSSLPFKNNTKADIIRYQKRDQGTDAMSPKYEWRNMSLDNIVTTDKERFAGWVPLPGMVRWKSDIYLTKSGKWEMVQQYENKSDIKKEVAKVYNIDNHQGKSENDIETVILTSTSGSDCDDSCSPKSTDTDTSSTITNTAKYSYERTESETVFNTTSDDNSKLTSEERDQALKELDDIVSGKFLKKIADFGSQDLQQMDKEEKHLQNDMSNFLSSMLKIDLSGLKEESSDESDRVKDKNSSSEDEILQFGCGRVAALAKHFSRMGEAGIIRGRGRGCRGKGINRTFYKSEPDVSNVKEDWIISPRAGDIILPSDSRFHNDKGNRNFHVIFTTVGLQPLGFSMDRLLDLGKGVTIKEMKNDDTERNFSSQKSCNENNLETNTQNEENITFIDSNGRDETSYKLVSDYDETENITFEEPVIDSIDTGDINLIDGVKPDFGEKHNVIRKLKDLKKISLSLDSYNNDLKKQQPIDVKKKSISVDEIELRKLKKHPLQKHYSLFDLGNIDKNDEKDLFDDDRVGALSDIGYKRMNKFKQRVGKFCSSEEINKTYGLRDERHPDSTMRRWVSIDDSTQRCERVCKLQKAEVECPKDNLRKVQRSECMGRKLKRMKKIDQKFFVVTPIRHSTDLSNDNVGNVTILAPDTDTTKNYCWSSRRNSSPVPFSREKLETCRPRRMSERDLPSRVLSEQQNLASRSQLPPHAPQIQSSKSVPSLHSGNHEIHNQGSVTSGSSGLGSRANHEVFNPGYSRTSSTNSIPQKAYEGQPTLPNTLRSRSSQNLADPRTSNLPPSSGNLGSRQASNPSLNHPQQMYQQQQQQQQQQQHTMHQHQRNLQQQHPLYQQHVHQQQQLMLQHQQQQQHSHQQQSSPSTGENGERFYQNLSIYRNQEMHNGYLPQGTGAGRGKMPSPQEERSPSHLQKGFRGSQSSLTTSRPPPDQTLNRPASAYLPQRDPNFSQQQTGQGMTIRSQSSRDMLRQEAKLQEMSEEVRRREMRVTSPHHYPPQRMQMAGGPPIQQQPRVQGPVPGYHHESYSNGPRAPDPSYHHSSRGQDSMYPNGTHGMYSGPINRGPASPYKQQSGPVTSPGVRPNQGEEIGYRESPPPPPPPPTSTHPLYQPQQRTDTRYAASMADPPRGGYYPSSPSNQPSRQYQFQGTNPWEREEREKEALRRREAARQWREQQIAELTNLGSARTQQQEEQLRALRLEKEFERRAEEEEEEEEDDQETTERVQGLLHLAQQQDEKKGATSRTPSTQQLHTVQTPPTSQPQINGIVGRTTIPPTYSGPGNEEKERLRRLKDMKMKQAEMEAEGRLKRKEEEQQQLSQQSSVISGHQQQQLQQQHTSNINNTTPLSTTTRQTAINQINTSRSISNNNPPSHLRLDNLIINSPASPGQQNYNGYGSNQNSPAGQAQYYEKLSPAQQRLDTLLGQNATSNSPPQPPERGSSFAVMSQTQMGTLRSPAGNLTMSPSSSVNTPQTTMGVAKRVSFQDSSPPSPPSNPVPSLENISEDPNHFINEAETMLASPKSPDSQFAGNTPGVIGAQEVYKDPRTRRLQEQQHQKLMTNKVPEKLSFKEKMKMFAMETGEDGTPRDKVKISRAQRDIDNLGTPTTPNNNAGAMGNN